MARPYSFRAQVPASGVGFAVALPARRCRILQIVPQTSTVDVQVSFKAGQANTTSEFFTLRAGQTISWDAPHGEELEVPEKIHLFATSAIAVDVVYWV